MLKNSIALDTINAENNTHLLEWQDVKNPSDEAVKLVDKIQKLQAEQEEDQESMDPYTKAKKSCDAKLTRTARMRHSRTLSGSRRTV